MLWNRPRRILRPAPLTAPGFLQIFLWFRSFVSSSGYFALSVYLSNVSRVEILEVRYFLDLIYRLMIQVVWFHTSLSKMLRGSARVPRYPETEKAILG